MRNRALSSIYLSLLAVWMQLILPVAAMSMDRPVDPSAVICSKIASGKDAGSPLHQHSKCDHCLLCHAYLGGAPLDDRAAYAVFDYPMASPLRWRLRVEGVVLRVRHRESQPRAPPATI